MTFGRLVRVCVGLALVAGLAPLAYARQAGDQPLVLVGDREMPPLCFLEGGVAKGLGVDVATAVGRVLGRRVRVELLGLADAQQRVLAGTADGMVMLSRSADREQLFDFSSPIVSRNFGVFVRAGSIEISDLSSLSGKRVGVVRGGVMASLLSSHPDIIQVPVDSYPQGFERLHSERVDAMTADQWVAAYILQRGGYGDIVLAGPTFGQVAAGIGVRKGNDQLLADVNRAIQVITGDGTLARIQAQWRPQEMVFMTRGQQQRLMLIAVGAVVAVVIVAMGLWVMTLKKHIATRQATEAALVESRQRLALALSAAEMGTWRWDAPTDQTTRDPSLNRMLGLDPVESTLSREEFISIIHPDDRAKAREEFNRALRDRVPYSSEYRVVRPDGGVRWLSEHGRAFYGDLGAVAYATGVAIDVSSQRQMQEALRVSEDRFAKAFEASPDCITISNAHGVIEVNGRFEQISGYAKEDLLGRTGVEIGLIEPQAMQEFRALFQANGSVRDFEYQLKAKSGELRTLLVSAEAVQAGGQSYVLAVNRDVTDQKRAEEALRRTETRYRDLVENANDIIFTVDPEGYCISMNRVGQIVTGYPIGGTPRGVNLRQLVAPEELAIVLGKLQCVMSGDDVAPFELDVISIEGKRTTLEVGVRPVLDNGAIIAAQGIARDVTTRRELEAQLRQAQKMDAIGRLAAGVAHDFNNLLTVILAHCESTAAQVTETHPLHHAMKGIRVAAERAASLTGQLLAFSRRQVTQPRPINLNDVVGDIQTMTTRLIGEDIEVRFHRHPDLWMVNADGGQIQQVVLNLAVNARDAMPHGGQLVIETRNVTLDGQYVQHHAQVPPGDYVVVCVSDTGVGMDQETLAHIFEPFFTTKEIGKGTGLGLATVYGIIKQSGGFIWVYSEIGIGTTFKIYLPRIQTIAVQAAVPPIRPEAASGSETVILVEDETDLRDILQHYLESKGYAVISAGDGQECLLACKDLSPFPRLLITDVVMPGMSGRTLADRLRADNPSIKVLYLSGYTDDAVLRHGILPNDTHFLQKPFALHDLAVRVRVMLDGAQAPGPAADLN